MDSFENWKIFETYLCEKHSTDLDLIKSSESSSRHILEIE